MNNWRDTLITADTPAIEAIKVIEGTSAKICLVVDGYDNLLGTVTDGDIRRAILRGIGLDAPVSTMMNRRPRSVAAGTDPATVRREMGAEQIRQMPFVDSNGRVVGLISVTESSALLKKGHWVVIMAGGLGTRLRPLTAETPKPMLPVGDKPLMQTIIEGCRSHGFTNFYVAVNYKADMVMDHFGDGSSFGVRINYLRETTSLGTAGALGLIEEMPEHPLVVMNGDLLTNADFDSLLQYHGEQRAVATMAAREYDVEVPFGVIRTDGDRILGIDEKPVHRFLVNAGIYVLEPEVLSRIDGRRRLDMPDLFQELLEAKRRLAVFPIREYWLDVGRLDDLHRANSDIRTNF